MNGLKIAFAALSICMMPLAGCEEATSKFSDDSAYLQPFKYAWSNTFTCYNKAEQVIFEIKYYSIIRHDVRDTGLFITFEQLVYDRFDNFVNWRNTVYTVTP